MNTLNFEINENKCPKDIRILVERIANVDDNKNTIFARHDLHINVLKDQDIIVKIEPNDLDPIQQSELVNRIEEILSISEYIDSNNYDLKKSKLNPIEIKFSNY